MRRFKHRLVQTSAKGVGALCSEEVYEQGESSTWDELVREACAPPYIRLSPTAPPETPQQ